MQFALLIYQGTTPLPNTPAWEALTADEQQKIYADYAAINTNPAVSPGLPLGQPDQARTVRVSDGKVVTSEGPFMGTAGRGRGVPRARGRRRSSGDRACGQHPCCTPRRRDRGPPGREVLVTGLRVGSVAHFPGRCMARRRVCGA
jgi:hypothetical protein